MLETFGKAQKLASGPGIEPWFLPFRVIALPLNYPTGTFYH